MWQKAKVLEAESTPWWIGKEIWTKGIPRMRNTLIDNITGEISLPQEVVQINLLTDDNMFCYIGVKFIELLGGEDAFCENPPLIPFKE